MAADHLADKRARLHASKSRWTGRTDDVSVTQPLASPSTEKCHKDSIRQWLNSITEEDSKPVAIQDTPARRLKRNGSSEDDLALGIEASLYGKPAVRATEGYLRSFVPRTPLPRWNSLTSAFSTHSGPLSVMDVLNLWQDDPEELLLDLGFGAEEPDITVKIPARFINHQSKARGINIQLFLEAQKNRMDIENPDVRNRFRQLEVLQQVTTAFNSLVGGPAQVAEKPGEPQISAETRERRKRVGMLLRKASKKSLSQAATSQDQQPLSPPLTGPSYSPDLPADPPQDKRSPVKRARQCLPEIASLSPLVEEQNSIPEAAEPSSAPPQTQCKSSGPSGVREPCNVTFAHKGQGQPAESFELEEIQSFDEGSIAGSCTGPADHAGSEQASLSRVSSCVVRTNSCQSDSSGFLEEPFVPAFSQHPCPGPELMKVLHAMSGESTDSQQKSVEQQETVELHSTDHSISSERMLEHTESCETQSNAASRKELTGGGDAAESYLQDADEVDVNFVQKDVAEDYTGKSTTLQDTDRLDCSVDVYIVSKDIAEDCISKENITSQDTSKVDYLVDADVARTDIAEDCMSKNTTAEDIDHVECLVDVNVAQKDIAKDCKTSENTTAEDTNNVDCLGEINVAQKELAVDHNTGQSATAVEDSLSPPPDVIPQADSQKEVRKSECTAFDEGSFPFDLEADITENKKPTETNSGGGYSGRSVSVQMRSSLSSVSQSSFRGSLSHSLSLGPNSPSSVETRRESFSHRNQSDANKDHLSSSPHNPASPEQVTSSPHPWHSEDSFKGLPNLQLHSTTLDMGTSHEEDKRWEGTLWTGTGQCCCSCDHNCHCCCQNKSGQKQHSSIISHLHTASSLPYSLDELEGMMRCMRKFRWVLSEIEERLQEEHTSVLNSLSDVHRADVQGVLELRAAVKQEAVLLEQQLTDLVHAYDDSIKMKLNRLLDEQSQLCSQLHITPFDTPHPANTCKRSVAVQCCLLPGMDTTQSCLSQQPTSDSDFTNGSDWSPSSKTDKLDFVGFIKSLKDVTINNDSLE
ncbi:protein ITPRID1 isoform X1 [Astyanax mexicanus]|uniref:protein ITPRID1 isoform X1 n=2 Tax=Astyanax mexicanus TaxID=7994 RepID=UPI0020CA9EEE|nr:protein ITPRID1 isoform X1 [Astyanax mexicanus]XP_007249627.3 protein ITPRID1 isoform X1 [Astyanax mexicanus]XP_022529340.2 protein ITPRID1 isoform X1 [Astyanax mexicanus]